jgi:hypothetical protein
MKRDTASGRWLPGESANPLGPRILTPARKKALERRQRAERARKAAQESVAQKFQSEVVRVSEATIKAAIGGDPAAQRLVLERVDPPRKPESPPIVVPNFDADAETASASVVAMVARGEISVEKGAQLLDILSKRAEISFAGQVVEQLARLKGNLQRHGLTPLVAALTSLSVDKSR